MPLTVRNMEYFHLRVEDEPEIAYRLLETLASAEVNLLAFSAVPYGNHYVELTVFPDDSERFRRVLEEQGRKLEPPQHALLIQDDDQLGAIAGIHRRLLEAGVSIYASSGVISGGGRFGYIIYVKEGDHEKAAKALA
jgi:hypothetical protein